MSSLVLYSLAETALFPDFSPLYRRLGIEEYKAASMRKAIGELKKRKPDVVVAEFLYGYGNNYAGVNISNLDVFLYGLQKAAPGAKVIVLVDKQEWQYVDKLNDIFPLHAVLTYPADEQAMEAVLGVDL